jgi:hypothetical protein
VYLKLGLWCYDETCTPFLFTRSFIFAVSLVSQLASIFYI